MSGKDGNGKDRDGKEGDGKKLANLPGQVNYPIGYGKPPAHSRFKPGKSGNPKGRPKGAKNRQPALNAERMKAILLEEAYREIKVNEGSRQITVPMAQAVIRAIAVNAVKGHQRSQRLFTELVGETERERRLLHHQWLETAITYKVEWNRELERRARLGITGPEPIPHPDHVIIDMRTGSVAIKGPMTREEKAELDMWIARKAEFEEELSFLEDEFDAATDPGMRAALDTEIIQTRKILDAIRKLVP